MTTTCSIEGCESKTVGRGWCRKHYTRWSRTGGPLQAKYDRLDGDPLLRWWAKVDKNGPVPTARSELGPCWLWTGSKDRHGYGQFDVHIDGAKKNHRAHRWGYQQLVRELEASETLDHLCRVRPCVNPAHLDPVTHAVNVRRGTAGQRNRDATHCPNGHLLTADNVILTKNQWRSCRECQRARTREANRKTRGTIPGDYRVGGVIPDSCLRGHPYTPENTYLTTSGGRECRVCRNARARTTRAPSEHPSNSEKTHCPRGHPYDSENTVRSNRGHRECRKCRTEYMRLYMRARRGSGEVVTPNGDKDFCPQGHEYDEQNTLFPKRGGRACRECVRVASLRKMRAVRGTPDGAVHNRDKTHCKNGHEFTAENTKLTATGARICKACRTTYLAQRRTMKLTNTDS